MHSSHNIFTTNNISGDNILDIKSMCNSGLATLSIASIILFSASYPIGWGPVVFMLVGEIVPHKLGALAVALLLW